MSINYTLVDINCNQSNDYDVTSFDFKQYDFPNANQTPFRTLVWHHYVKIIITFVVIVVVIVGNCCVIITVMRTRALRTRVNIYLANLAISDIFISLFCIWVLLIHDLTHIYVLGPIVCKLNGFAQMASLTSSVLTLTAISCDRFVAIICPLRIRVIKRHTSRVISLIWIISLIVSIPFLIYRQQLKFHWRNYTEINCFENWPAFRHYNDETRKCVIEYPAKKIYYSLITITLFFIPIIVMTFNYTVIIWRLWITTKIPGIEYQVASVTKNRTKKKVIKMVVIILICFVLCWLPLQYCVIYSQFLHNPYNNGELPKWFPVASYFAHLIAYSNSALNPIIYGGLSQNFRDSVYNAICLCNKAKNNTFCFAAMGQKNRNKRSNTQETRETRFTNKVNSK